MLAHELRNPLASLSNASEILQTADASLDEREQSTDGSSLVSAESMTRMIDDLLDVSRINEGKIDLRLRPVALADILTAAASVGRSVVRSGKRAGGQELAVSLPAEPIFLDADATRLDQVFANLLGNACKYSGDGSHIWLSAERVISHGDEPPEVIIRIRDDGLGIAPELLPHIFDLFVQSTRALDRASGRLNTSVSPLSGVSWSCMAGRLRRRATASATAANSSCASRSSRTLWPCLNRRSPPPVRDIPRRMLIVDDNEDAVRAWRFSSSGAATGRRRPLRAPMQSLPPRNSSLKWCCWTSACPAWTVLKSPASYARCLPWPARSSSR